MRLQIPGWLIVLAIGTVVFAIGLAISIGFDVYPESP
jgi:hypothetical protein